MGIEGIARHQGTLKLIGGVFVEHALGDGKFAVVLFAAVGALREGLAGGVETECHHAPEPTFGTDGFTVQREGFGEKFAVFHQPGVEGLGEFDRVDAVDDVVERPIAGHGQQAGLFVALGQTDGPALVLVKGGAFLPDGFDVGRSADESIDDEGEHGAEGMADGFWVAGVGEALQRLAQGAQLGAFQGATGTSSVATSDGGLVDGWQQTGAGEQGDGVLFQGANPEVLGFSRVLIEVAAVSFEALGEAEGLPVGSFVEGAGVFVWIVETLRQKGLEAVPGLELAAKGAQGKGKALAGKIGAAGRTNDTETPQLHDEFEAIGAGKRVPAYVIVAFLEAFGGTAPAEDGDEFVTVRLGVPAVDALPEDMPGRASRFQIVVLVEGLAEVVDLGGFSGGTQDEVVGNKSGFGHQYFHDAPNLPKLRPLSSFFSNLPCLMILTNF